MDEPQFDPDLLLRAKAGDSLAFERLFSPVRTYAGGLAKKFFVSGWDKEDLYQEALAGFAVALLTYESSRGASFHDFARMSMRNAVVACVRRATRLKRQGAESVSTSRDDASESGASPEFRTDIPFEQQHECNEMLAALRDTLSPAEWNVLRAVMAGAPLTEVAEQVGITQRAAQNALARARVKARRLLVVA